jgi:hypothetical protein
MAQARDAGIADIDSSCVMCLSEVSGGREVFPSEELSLHARRTGDIAGSP